MTPTAWVIVIGVGVMLLAAFELWFRHARRRQRIVRAMLMEAFAEVRDSIIEAEEPE